MTVIFVKSTPSRNSPIRCKQETVDKTESPLKKKSSRKLRYIIFIIPLLLFFLIYFSHIHDETELDIRKRLSYGAGRRTSDEGPLVTWILYSLGRPVRMTIFFYSFYWGETHAHDVNATCCKSSNLLCTY